MKLGIVTPTFRRYALRERFLEQLRKQTHADWTAILVHDGPCKRFEARMSEWHKRDPRILFSSTELKRGDYGASGRLRGIEQLAEWRPDLDGLVFWDDDDLFFPDSLAQIARAFAAADLPDLLLIPFHFRDVVLPPSGRAVRELALRELTTANLVFRPRAARIAYADVVDRGVRRATDYHAFEVIRTRGDLRIALATGAAPIGIYDGLKWLPRLLWNLGARPLAYDWLSWRRLRAALRVRTAW